MPTYRLTAHNFDRIEGGMLAIELFMTRGETKVEAATFPELEGKIKEFGMAHAPCVVWVGAATKPKPRGFDKWNHANGANKWVFEPLKVETPTPAEGATP